MEHAHPPVVELGPDVWTTLARLEALYDCPACRSSVSEGLTGGEAGERVPARVSALTPVTISGEGARPSETVEIGAS